MVQSLMALFFHLRFGVSLTTLSALSFLAAVPLARRFVLLNTMVFTHLPSNILLALVAFAPTFPIAAALLLVHQALSQMDVPTRLLQRGNELPLCHMILFLVHPVAPLPALFLAPGLVISTDLCFHRRRDFPL